MQSDRVDIHTWLWPHIVIAFEASPTEPHKRRTVFAEHARKGVPAPEIQPHHKPEDKRASRGEVDIAEEVGLSQLVQLE